MYRVDLHHWVDGGWSHCETFDNLNEYCTAREYIKSLDCPISPPTGVDDTRVEVYGPDDRKLSECWVSEA